MFARHHSGVFQMGLFVIPLRWQCNKMDSPVNGTIRRLLDFQIWKIASSDRGLNFYFTVLIIKKISDETKIWTHPKNTLKLGICAIRGQAYPQDILRDRVTKLNVLDSGLQQIKNRLCKKYKLILLLKNLEFFNCSSIHSHCLAANSTYFWSGRSGTCFRALSHDKIDRESTSIELPHKTIVSIKMKSTVWL